MSGRQHHYLPQFLQRPFAYRRSGKQFYVYAHHRTRGSFTPNTKGLGTELDFYGGPEDTALDDAITSGEDTLAAIVQAVNEGQAVSALEKATLISALAFRTKSMREALAGMLPVVLDALRERLLDITRLRRDLMASLTDPKESRRLINEEVKKRMGHLPREQRARAAYALRSRWKSHVFEQEEQLVAQAWRLATVVLEKARMDADTIAHGAYLQALARDPAMPVRAQKLAEELAFDVIDAPPDEFFILGDCGPVAMFTDGKPRLLLGALEEDVKLQAAFLPVSPSRCIVGRLPTSTTSLGTGDINRLSASLSLEFIVSHTPASDDLRTLIGSQVPFETAQDIIRKLGDDEAG